MSSILTNTSAMVALQTLQGVNKNLSNTQNEISTGKAVATAKDNAAVWAISTVMQSDVSGFKSISDSLSLGSSTVSVASQASQTVTDLLTQMKTKIVAAQQDNVDRTKIQTDVTALANQIKSVVSAAQFNGLNLVDGSTGSTDVLASLDRDSSGNVTAKSITVNAQDLSTGGYVAQAVFTGTTGVAADTADSFAFSMDKNGGTSDNGTVKIDSSNMSAGDQINMTIGDKHVSYTVTAADMAATTPNDVIATGLKAAIEGSGANVTVDYNSSSAGQIKITNNDTTNAVSVSGQYKNVGSGGLGLLSTLDVSNKANAQTALGNIETLIQTSVDAAASFGSAQTRIDTQNTFVTKLTDSLKTGIGAMVDANMEQASARLQALQVQQQLAVQSLSIANKAPQTILSLFR